MRDDQVVLRVDRGLHIVADDPGALAARGHRASVRVGQRDLLVGCGLHRGFDLLELLHLLLQRRDLLFQPDRLSPARPRPPPDPPCRAPTGSGRCWLRSAPSDAGSWCGVKFLSRLFTALNLLPSIATDRLGEQVKLAAQHHELAARRADGRPVVLAEIGDRLEVRRQPAGQPHHLDVALRLTLQTPARLHAVEVAVEIESSAASTDGRPGGRSPRGLHRRSPVSPDRVRQRTLQSPGPGCSPSRNRPGRAAATPPADELHPPQNASFRYPKSAHRQNISWNVFTQPPPIAAVASTPNSSRRVRPSARRQPRYPHSRSLRDALFGGDAAREYASN